MGNGVYLEDGLEHHNNIEHNLMTNCIMTGKGTEKLNVPEGQTQNTGNVIGNGGFDNYPVASIWLTNTCNFVHRNVICNNATSGIAVWAVPINPRTKSGPANLCTGLANPQLPGLIGKALIGRKPDGSSNFRLLTNDCVPVDMRKFFATVVADGSTEAVGNLKNFVSNPSLQSYVLFAENTIYSMNGGLVEANNEDPIYARRPALFEATSESANYIPINSESAGSLLSNNPQDYPRPGMTIAQANVQAQNVPRALFQNLVYGLYGVKAYQFGGFVWIQQGPTICIGNCVLGGEYWSAGSSFKAMISQEHLMGNFAGLHIDMITNCSVTGSGDMALDHKSGCQGILVSGPKTTLGADTCIGARTAVPPNSVGGSPCVPADGDAQPSFVMFAEGIAYADVKALILKWLTTYKNFTSADINHFTALGGLANGGKTCCTVDTGGWYCGESRQDLQYVFFPDENLSIGLDADFALRTTTWNPKDTQAIPADSVPLCNAAFNGAADYAAQVYPALGSPAVVELWSKACAFIGISPGAL